MATDTFTCSRCGQVSYYRDGSYLFGQQVVCARCYAAQAAPPGVAMPPGGVPPVPQGYPGAPPGVPGAFGYAAPPAAAQRRNICGLIGIGLAVVALGSCVTGHLLCREFLKNYSKAVQGNSVEEMMKKIQDYMQKEGQPYLQSHPEASAGFFLMSCGTWVLALAGVILSIVGLCLSNVKKASAAIGLVLSVLALASPCCISGLMSGLGG